MDSKYYIPALEEFHVGFRYELLNPNGDGDYEDSFDWEEHSLWGNLEEVAINLEDGLVRVKYLDQADLERLGWERVEESIYEKVIDRGDKNYCWQIKLNQPPEIYIRSYLLNKGDKWRPTYSIQFGLAVDVKNYNEMEKLMQMFQIV